MNFYRQALIAAAMAHVEGFYSVNSRAHRNCNPGNIEHADGTMHQYPDMVTGFQALCEDIAYNEGKSLRAFIAKYAPPNENDTQNYLDIVCGICMMDADDLL